MTFAHFLPWPCLVSQCLRLHYKWFIWCCLSSCALFAAYPDVTLGEMAEAIEEVDGFCFSASVKYMGGISQYNRLLLNRNYGYQTIVDYLLFWCISQYYWLLYDAFLTALDYGSGDYFLQYISLLLLGDVFFNGFGCAVESMCIVIVYL